MDILRIKNSNNIFEDAQNIVEQSRNFAYHAVNYAMVLRNWLLGKRIAEEEFKNTGRAEYGKETVKKLADYLSSTYGKGFDRISLYNYVKFYKLFPEIVDATNLQSEKVGAVSQQMLPWTHYRELLRVSDEQARKWYEQEALNEMWSTRILHRNIASQYYYRLLQSQDKRVVKKEQHIRTDMGDFFIDLVFYNYILKCFLLIDLKTCQITHQDVGQMDMYVRMFDKLKRTDGDNPTIGLILCSETSDDMARYSVLNDNERLFQAKYLTYLPTVEQLRTEIEQQKEIFRLQMEEETIN